MLQRRRGDRTVCRKEPDICFVFGGGRRLTEEVLALLPEGLSKLKERRKKDVQRRQVVQEKSNMPVCFWTSTVKW